MNYQCKTTKISSEKTGLIILPIFENNGFNNSTKAIDNISQNYLTKIIKRGDFTGKAEQTLLLQNVPHVSSERILLVGFGTQENLNALTWQKCLKACIAAIKNTNSIDVVFYFEDLLVKYRQEKELIRDIVQEIHQQFYTFNQFKSKSKKESSLKKVIFHANNNEAIKLTNQAIKEGEALSIGMTFMKDLANSPSNVATPDYFAKQVKSFQKEYKKIKVDVLDEKALKKLGANTILAVGKGSQNPPRLITIQYQGGKKSEKPIALIGKGITFDTGGVSLKPRESLEEMKFDMCGAASVAGAIKAAAELNLPINIVGILACAENAIGSNAIRPGDIVTSLSGQTVEIVNTDAEGRLVLCDAITYVRKFNPSYVVDVATLTGAIIIALGHQVSGLFCDDEFLSEELKIAGKQSLDPVWQMPIIEEYQTRIDSACADIVNATWDRSAGSIIAACFLQRFTKDLTWAHLDIAGSAHRGGSEKLASGRPVPLLLQFLINQSK